MRRIAAGLFVLAAMVGTIAYASSDGGDGPGSWNPEQSSAILNPTNDTRTNLLLLLADRQGTATANLAIMAKGIVPIELSWRVMRARLSPPPTKEEDRSRAYYPEYVDGSRCQSNESGSEEFVEAARTTRGISADEVKQLVAAREALRPTCDTSDASNARPNGLLLISPAARQFSTYLVGADEFYRGEYAAAASHFSSLTNAPAAWVRETSLYMVARNELNRAQAVSLDEYGSLAPVEKRDQRSIAAAEQAFLAYLEVYPKGRYAGSARGLLRRVNWLQGDRAALGAAYSATLASPAARDGTDANLDLIEEIDIKLLPEGDGPGVTDPVLLAVVDLLRLRKSDPQVEDYEGDWRGPKLERTELLAQRPHFKSSPVLFEYLVAVEAFYGRNQPREVLALIPAAAHQRHFSYVQFSRQMLRGFALDAIKDSSARGFWLSLLPGANQPYQREAVELALAEHDRKMGTIESLFAPGSPVRHPLIRQHVLEDSAGPALLRRQATDGTTEHEREVSLYLLLADELHHGIYADFIRDLGMVGNRKAPDDADYYWDWDVLSFDPQYNDVLGAPPLYVFASGGSDDLDPCPNIRTTAVQLSQNPAAIRPRLCLAEFIRQKGFDGWNITYDAQYRPVSRSRNGFPGKPAERMDIYRSIIESKVAAADDKAFALNRAVRCFAPSGSSSCGGNDDIPVAQRKAWFTQLKRDYPQSAWAQDLRYYW